MLPDATMSDFGAFDFAYLGIASHLIGFEADKLEEFMPGP